MKQTLEKRLSYTSDGHSADGSLWPTIRQCTLSAELQRAEDLMYSHPDSALHILQAMTPPEDELNHATWALLMTQAKYKCDVKQSDSLLNIAHDYFMKRDNAQRKALVLYHKGVFPNEKNQVDSALPYYLQASEFVENSNDFKLSYLIYNHIGTIYRFRNLENYTLDFYEKANKVALLSQDSYYINDSYINLARVNAMQKKYENAIKFYIMVIELAKENNDQKNLVIALTELAGVHLREKNYSKAIHNLYDALRITPSDQIHYILGHAYYRINETDSAYYYLNKAINAESIYTIRSAYQILCNLSKKTGDYKKNAEYTVKLWKINDSINKIDRNKALIEMQEKYDQQRVKDEMTAKMTLQKQRIMMGIGVAVLILCFIAYRIRIRNKERITRLAEAEERIETLNHLLEEAQKEPSPDAGEDDTFFKRILLQQLGIIRMVANTPTAQNQALLRRLAETGNDEMPAEELIAWKDLYPIIDRLYHGFYTRLTQHFGSVLTDKEVQTCCLLCAGFSTKEIAVITRQASSTVYFRKTSARQKMGMPEGADIVEWVKNFSLKSV
ncbi:MAG: tetratricopeptide repeat protein [Bacteroidaceae bacterium]|nr:tetratricopeptide repeat protein [Bacteroidaceae bacterium]